MIKKILCFFVLAVSSGGFSYAQAPNLVSVTPPSPNVQALQKYGDIPVSAYTGIPDISIPIYTAKFRDISIPVSISYHASGIKVAEEASQVGLGWALNAGGMVSRNVVGKDDFIGSNYFTSSIIDFDSGQGPTGRVQLGCNLQMFNIHSSGNTIFNYDVSPYLLDQAEFQPDQFYYNFEGHCGKFVLTRTLQAVTQKQENIQVTCQSTSGSAFQIKSIDGYTYDFTLQETYKDPGTNQSHISGWYLTAITSPTGNTATFNYTANPTVIQGIGTFSEQRDDKQFSFPTYNHNNAPSYGYQHGVTPGSVYSNQLLSSIDMPDCRVQFYYSGNRLDLTGDQRLDSVSVFIKNKAGEVSGRPIRTTTLSYDYFNYADADDIAFGGSNTGSIFSQRMKLVQVQNTGYFGGNSIAEPPYVLNYYEGDIYHTLPSKGSFARDHWGYYNGKTGHSSLIPSYQTINSNDPVTFALALQGPERDPDSAYAGAFSLQSIRYPTGGTTRFQYQSNDFDIASSQTQDNSAFANTPEVVPWSQTLTYDAFDNHVEGTDDTLHLENEFVAPDGSISPVTINMAFRFGQSTECSISPHPLHSMYFALYDSTGNNEIQEFDLVAYNKCPIGTTTYCYTCGSGVFSINTTFPLRPGKYIFKAFNGGGQPADLETIIATFNFSKVVVSQPNSTNQGGIFYATGGGQRISRIIDEDPLNPAANKLRKYIYHYWTDKIGAGSPQEYSFGRRMSKPGYSFFAYDWVSYSFINGDACGGGPPYYTFHLLRTSDSDNPLNGSAAGAVVGYDQVTELLGENGEYGQKVYRYNNTPDYVPPYNDLVSLQNLPLRPPYGSNIPNALNGTLIGETDYSNTNGSLIKIKEVTNTYETVLASENRLYGLQSTKINAVNLGADCRLVVTDLCDGNSLTLTYVAMPSEWQRLYSSEEKDFNEGDSVTYLDTYTHYIYDNPAHKQVTRAVTTNSKGQVVTSATQYPLDFPNPLATDPFTLGIAKLQQSHIISQPVERHIYKTDADGGNPRTVSAVLTYFNSTSPTASAIYRTEKASPITAFAPAAVSSSGLASNSFYVPYINFDQYDAFGNILQQRKSGDLPHSYIWDYGSNLLVAEATNANQADIAYTSFESDGTGNWTLSSSVTNDGGITGTKCYNLGNGAISRTGLQAGNTYVVSYWSQNGAYTISGGAGSAKTGRSINNWTYYEHTVVASSSTFSINGGGNIDELRLYPATAQMTTYTHAPLVGLTSQCDAGSRITYFEYDGLGRLQDVKDQDGNILKTYEYQYRVPVNAGGQE